MGEATGGGYLPIDDDAFVLRSSRTSYVVASVALAGLTVGSFFVLGWMFAAGTLILSLALAGLIYGVTRMNSDSGGVQLAVDREGIYLGRQYPLRLEWTRIAEVVTFLGDSHDSEGERWVPYLVVRLRPGESDSLDPLDWGPSCRPDLAATLAVARTAVRHHAPHVPVRDLGELSDRDRGIRRSIWTGARVRPGS